MKEDLDREFIVEHYARMSDAELVNIATCNAEGLSAAAIEIAKAELQKRKIDSNLTRGFDAQRKIYTEAEIDEYCDLISELPCPDCGQSGEKLNGTVTGTVMSFLIFTTYDRRLRVACPACLDKANNYALARTAILGWWGIPWGIIHSVRSIYLNIKNKRGNHYPYHNDFLRNFALQKVGEIEVYKEDKEKLREVVRDFNR